MPWPSKLEQRPGFLSLDSPLRYKVIGKDKRLPNAVSHFKEQLSLRTGIAFRAAEVTSSPVLEIRCQSIGPSIQKLGEDESYQLSVVPEKVELTAANPLGILRGVETLLQLVQSGASGWIIPALEIDDHPRFPWRGLMIDVSRHFIPLEILKRNIDGMAAVTAVEGSGRSCDDVSWLPSTTRVAPFSSVKSSSAHMVLRTTGGCGKGSG